ncbi:SgrR family transcriptional regulator [Vibrio sp. JC009]|uniref:SgrR family transcriptional regulator n=1 Tax=Vibrio sp. JC009 TaxID=2912314 RepID=UPI0023B0557B|nr:SgrR family transcriptional regulator [Vibrio sp. JC009]WED24310.1 SgrR family transcriptional regulator [Vibrio sp. JC009]
MSDNRLILHFSRLTRLGVNKEIPITLSEVAEALYTSPRHCRTLLKQMQQSGWIEWTPKVGRNQRSRLYLIYSLERLKTELAQQLISKGKYEKALEAVDNDQALFAQLLESTSGTQRRQGQLHVQLTYDREFSPLLPHTPLRNSERFLLRQIYSCLTRCDESCDVQPELAHHWIYDENKLSWRFFLRPRLQFHNGSDITSAEIVSLFEQLRYLPIYRKELAHIKSIAAINPQCVEFTLSQADAGFAALLSDLKYSIQPVTQLSGTSSVTGSGIFQVQEHSKQKLTLQAFNGYHGFNALTDTVTIWQLPTQTSTTFGDTHLQAGIAKPSGSPCSNYLSVECGSVTDPTSESDLKSRVEDGCLLAIVNSQANLSLPQRKYLSELIATDNLLQELGDSGKKVEAEPAYNLLPGWMKILPTGSSVHPLPESFTIAIFEHHALKKCAEAVTELLSRAGVTCTTNIYPFDDFYAKSSNQSLDEDIILTSMNLDDNRPVSAFCWMLSNPVLHQSLTQQNRKWLEEKLFTVRNRLPVSSYMQELESITSALISSHCLIPMFHHRQTLRFEGVLKSVDINVWGWPEIRDVWSDE